MTASDEKDEELLLRCVSCTSMYLRGSLLLPVT